MRCIHYCGAIAIATLSLCAADKKLEPARAADDQIDLRGTIITNREAIKEALGIDPGTDLILIDIEVRPKTDSGVRISRDDFVLLARNDGQRSPALHPSQIAGSGALMVQSQSQGASGGMLGRPRPVWGGIPGTSGRPGRTGTNDDVSSVTNAEARSTVTEENPEDTPLMTALRNKELPVGEIKQPVHGFLYYVLEGKHKIKDLDLMFKAHNGQLVLDFQK